MNFFSSRGVIYLYFQSSSFIFILLQNPLTQIFIKDGNLLWSHFRVKTLIQIITRRKIINQPATRAKTMTQSMRNVKWTRALAIKEKTLIRIIQEKSNAEIAFLHPKLQSDLMKGPDFKEQKVSPHMAMITLKITYIFLYDYSFNHEFQTP